MIFLVYVTAFYLLVRKPARSGWEKRRLNIEGAVQSGRVEIAQADGMLNEIRSKLTGINAEIKEIERELALATSHECEELRRTAQDRSEKIVQRAKDSARVESRSAELALRREMGELALQIATQRLSNSLSPELERRWREAALKNISGLMN